MELFLDELTNMLTVTSSETAGRVRGRVEMLRGSLLARAPWPLRPPAKWMVPRDGVFAAGGTDPVGHCTLGPLLTARIPTMPSHPAANGRTALGASSVPDAPTTPGAALLNFSFMFPRSVRLVTIVPVVAQKPVVDALAANMDRWRTLSHPNIAAPAGMCVNTDHPFLVLPHLHSDLFTIQAHQDGTEMSTKVRWIADIARGMRYLHSQHPPIVHGRLSLSNVLLDHTGCARIVGLGMEKTASWPQSQGRITWLPPELAKNTKSPLTLKSDVFAFGLTCASVLAGPLYASQESYQRALENWESISARPGRPPRISPFLWSLIERCWSVDPDDRPEFGHILVELSQIPGAVSQAEMGFMGVVAASDPAMSSAETRPRKRSESLHLNCEVVHIIRLLLTEGLHAGFEADMLEKPASKHLRRQRSMSITSGPVLGPSLAPDEQIAVLLEVLPAFMAGKGITADNWRVKVNSFENDNTRTAIARDDEGNIVVLCVRHLMNTSWSACLTRMHLARRGKIDELCAFPTKITTLSHLRTL
nr:hypothetical protein HK105_004472 [Polyrhizophydium stewartii]